MIKTIFHSTETGENYDEIGKALEAEFKKVAPEGRVEKEEKKEENGLEKAIQEDEFLHKTITADGKLTDEFDKDIDKLLDAFREIAIAEEKDGKDSLQALFAKAAAYEVGDRFVEKYGREALEIVTLATGLVAAFGLVGNPNK